jgi:spore coat polysaccharide biosynthesis protein SpsF (cytidylyltransferase family)
VIPEYFKIQYNLTHYSGPLVCQIVQARLVNVRRRLNQTILRKLFQGYMITQAVQRDELIAFLDQVYLKKRKCL